MAHTRRTAGRASIALAAVALLIAGAPGAVPPAAAEPSFPAGATPAAPAAPPVLPVLPDVPPGTYQITLITGDRVELVVEPGGRYETSADDPTRFQTEAGPDGVYMYPEEALPAVQRGLLDPELFHVSYLAANGYADAATGRLPVILTYPRPAGPGRAAPPAAEALADRADRLPATAAPTGLTSVNGAGVGVDKDTAGQFWQQLTGGATAAGPVPIRALDQGVAKVWLDRRVTVTLDESVPLVGAPEAWQAGLDGTGVTVAVLDTGIDDTHPDLAGTVVAAKSFVPGVAEVADGHGHGTHVAATIAGSGAAADGSRPGVAPGAQLAIGKVLSDAGSGSATAIIAGMEWAAAEQDADIVSISLGGGPTDGTDILSQAVNDLTASTGALFVIAAGNDGPAAETVATPGAASAALTVAATDKQDQVASFSSRGPRTEDLALKPDIAAPGVGIVAARAAGTSMGTPVDEHYTRANGTSMATPHVAGAAALLAQRHPDWPPGSLKAALMSTATDVGQTVYDRGAGRLDAARAVRQQVVAGTANLDYGLVETSESDPSPPLSRQVAYRNLTDQPVTLALAPSLAARGGGTAPDGALTTDPAVTVPAGGTATATVTLDVSGLDLGSYSGAVTATDDATGTRLTTPVGLVLEPPKVTLTIRTLDRLGAPIGHLREDLGGSPGGYSVFATYVSAVDVPGLHSVTDDVVEVEPGVERIRVVPGTYNLRRVVRWWDDAEEDYVEGVLFNPQVTVTAEAEVTLDARAAERVEFHTPRPAVGTIGQTWADLRIERTIWDGRLSTSTYWAHYVTPTEPVSVGTFRVAFTQDLVSRQLSASVTGPGRFDLHPESLYYADQGFALGGAADGGVTRTGGWVPFPAGTHQLELVDAGFGDPADLAGLDLQDKLALVQWGDDRRSGDGAEGKIWTDRIANVREAGATGVVLFPNPPHEPRHGSYFAVPAVKTDHWPEAGEQEFGIPDIEVKRSEGLRLLELLDADPVTIEVRSDPNLRYVYHLHPTFDQQIPGDLRFTFDRTNLAQVDSTIHSVQPLERARYDTSSWKPGTFMNSPQTVKFAVPKPSLTEYFGPLASDVVYTRRLSQAFGLKAAPRVFDRPIRISEPRHAVPYVPGAVGVDIDAMAYLPPPGAVQPLQEFCDMCRQGDTLLPSGHLTAGGGDYRGQSPDLTTARLFTADGTEIPRVRRDLIPVFHLPPEPGQYRLVQDRLGVASTWTFNSATPQRDTVHPWVRCWGPAGWTEPCHPEPFVFLRYDLGDQLRLDNTVPAGPVNLFEVTAYHNPQSTVDMPGIAGLRLWTSTDGGEQWRPVLVVPRRGAGGERTFTAIARYLDQPGAAVSLRAEAWDQAGNRIEQTVRDAFTLSSRG